MATCPHPPRGFFRGPICDFEARYSTGPAQPLTTEQLRAIDEMETVYMEDVPGIIESMTTGAKTYEGEVCIRCGLTVRPPPKR